MRAGLCSRRRSILQRINSNALVAAFPRLCSKLKIVSHDSGKKVTNPTLFKSSFLNKVPFRHVFYHLFAGISRMLYSESFLQTVTAERQQKLYGIARVAIASLRFSPDEGAYEHNTDRKKGTELQRILQVSGCDRLSAKHRPCGSISVESFQAALDYSGLRKEGLQDAASPPFLSLPPHLFVLCAQSRSRVHAFMQTKQAWRRKEQWWTVELTQGRSVARSRINVLISRRAICNHSVDACRGIRK